jgi:hypothetical protein
MSRILNSPGKPFCPRLSISLRSSNRVSTITGPTACLDIKADFHFRLYRACNIVIQNELSRKLKMRSQTYREAPEAYVLQGSSQHSLYAYTHLATVGSLLNTYFTAVLTSALSVMETWGDAGSQLANAVVTAAIR